MIREGGEERNAQAPSGAGIDQTMGGGCDEYKDGRDGWSDLQRFRDQSGNESDKEGEGERMSEAPVTEHMTVGDAGHEP